MVVSKASAKSKKFPKPFFRKDRGVWCVQIKKKQINLGPDKEAALRKYHEVMSRPPEVKSELVVEILDGFIEAMVKRVERGTLAPRTKEWAQKHIQSFVTSLADRVNLKVEDLKKFHVSQWLDSKPTWGPNHARGAATAVIAAFNWASTEGYIPTNPLRGFQKPKAKRREQFLTLVEYERLLSLVKEQSFRDVLEFVWETGCRTQEVRVIEAQHVDTESRQVVLPKEIVKGKERARVIVLSEKAAEIVRRLAAEQNDGPIFRNKNGRPWTACAFNCRFEKIKKKTGTKYAMTSLRHSFVTRMIEAGVSDIVISELMGHKDRTMVANNYQHIGKKGRFLAETIDRVTRASSAEAAGPTSPPSAS